VPRSILVVWGPTHDEGQAMSFMEIAIWFAVSVFLVLRIAMLAAFIVLPVIVVKTLRRHATA
jgi:hypothetical protein